MGLELFEHVPGLIIVPGELTRTRTRTRARTRTLIIVPDGGGTRRAGAVDESAISASLLLAEAKVRGVSPNPLTLTLT